MNNKLISRIIWITVFGVAMAYVESAVVVYLRDIFHPEGFEFPLKAFDDYKIIVELFRELATIFILVSFAALAGENLWERFAYFMLSFGIWDIFYYVWLKLILDWPASIFEWDVLFLIPLPWIGPVIAPVSVSVLMCIFSLLMILSIRKGMVFRPTVISSFLALAGMAVVLYSFMYDTDATVRLQMPRPYRYDLLVFGDILFVAAFVVSYMKSQRQH